MQRRCGRESASSGAVRDSRRRDRSSDFSMSNEARAATTVLSARARIRIFFLWSAEHGWSSSSTPVRSPKSWDRHGAR